MEFIGRPLRVAKAGDRTWRLLAPLIFVGRFGAYAVPSGYVSDFATVPRLLWTLFPQSGRWDEAAVVHDWLITDGLEKGAVPITSPRVDAEFRAALRVLQVGWVQRWLMWAGVRWAAVSTRSRRPGWLRTLPQLLAVSAASLAPIVGAVWGLALVLP